MLQVEQGNIALQENAAYEPTTRKPTIVFHSSSVQYEEVVPVKQRNILTLLVQE